MNSLVLKLITIFSLIKLIKNNEILITIKGIGTQKILSDYYKGVMPDQIIVNGENQSNTTKYIESLTQEINNISLKWNNQIINNVSSMFRDLSNIIKFNFTNFDFSKIIDMSYMFYNCTSITNIDLSNINTYIICN